MAYSQTFTLRDIFNNPKLKNKMPQVNYKEFEREDGNISIRTAPKSVRKQVFEISKMRAKPYFKPLIVQQTDTQIILGGNMTGDINRCINDIYYGLQSQKYMLSFTANNTDMIRDALKEAEKNKRKYGNSSRLYLRVRSMQEIQGMSKAQINGLMDNIMENIIFGDDYPMTQKKYGVETFDNYARLKQNWKTRIGE